MAFEWQFLKEAGSTARVARYIAHLLDIEQEGVSIAVEPSSSNVLIVPARGTFYPDFLPGAAPVRHDSAPERLDERLAIHIGKHQNLTIVRVSRDYWNEAVLPKGHFVGDGGVRVRIHSIFR